MTASNTKTLATNRKAFFNYFVEQSLEAGIELCGTEVKSLRKGAMTFKDAWCEITGGEVFIRNMHISPYEQGNIFNRDPLRKRRLLLHRREIRQLQVQVAQNGFTLIPLSIYLKGPRVKVQLGVCRGKKNYDKRESVAKRDAARDIDRAIKGH